MHSVNLSIVFIPKTNPGGEPISIMCCFSVPSDVTRDMVAQAFSQTFMSSVEAGKRIGKTNGTLMVASAMKAVDKKFGGTSYLLEADAVSILNV